MITVIVYGRNDHYGYNLPKRAALSLNCIAELLLDDEDEIIFVDYNTPDPLPTFPESIEDTLTARTLQRLRILRVRPSFHQRFAAQTHLNVVEPVARNIAVRRSNPANQWILSTNTDMIFVSPDNKSLTEIASSTPHGHYGVPRFEIPEGIWESFNRMEPTQTMAAVREWAAAACLNEVVFGPPTVLYDGPGDFQLIDREDLFTIHGFDERMILGWHVDYNLAKRLTLLNGPIKSLSDRIQAYHCAHTRIGTAMHSISHRQNDLGRFVHQIEKATLPDQADNWGWPKESVEDIRLPNPSKNAYKSIFHVAGRQSARASSNEAFNNTTGYNNFWYDPRHVLPFAVDALSSFPRAYQVAWVGTRKDTLELFRAALNKLGFSRPMLSPATAMDVIATDEHHGPELVSIQDAIGAADILVFEFGLLRDEAGELRAANQTVTLSQPEIQRFEWLHEIFILAVKEERKRLKNGHVPRLFVTINAINNVFESMVSAHVAVSLTPFSSRTRLGFVRKTPLSRIRYLHDRIRRRAKRWLGGGRALI